jgi:hypothetical protein
VLWGVNIVFLLYGGHVIDVYDGCLGVADYLCGPLAICGASHVNCEHHARIWKNGRAVQKLLRESSRHVCRGRSELPAI